MDVATRADTDTFEEAIRALRNAFQHLTVISGPSQTASRAHNTTAVPQAPTTTPAAVNADRTSQNDEKSLRDTLRIDEKLVDPNSVWVPPGKQFPFALLGQRVVFKFCASGQGGWFKGCVVRVIDTTNDSFDATKGDTISNEMPSQKLETCNVQVKYDPFELDDGQQVVDVFCHSFLLENMVSKGTASKYSWGLINVVGLSNITPGVAPRNPLQSPQRGRKEAKRKAPHHGPTSQNYKKK